METNDIEKTSDAVGELSNNTEEAAENVDELRESLTNLFDALKDGTPEMDTLLNRLHQATMTAATTTHKGEITKLNNIIKSVEDSKKESQFNESEKELYDVLKASVNTANELKDLNLLSLSDAFGSSKKELYTTLSQLKPENFTDEENRAINDEMRELEAEFDKEQSKSYLKSLLANSGPKVRSQKYISDILSNSSVDTYDSDDIKRRAAYVSRAAEFVSANAEETNKEYIAEKEKAAQEAEAKRQQQIIEQENKRREEENRKRNEQIAETQRERAELINKYAKTESESIDDYVKRIGDSQISDDVISGIEETKAHVEAELASKKKDLTAKRKAGVAYQKYNSPINLDGDILRRTTDSQLKSEQEATNYYKELKAVQNEYNSTKAELDKIKDLLGSTMQTKEKPKGNKGKTGSDKGQTESNKGQTGSNKGQTNPLAKELSQLADDARQEANESIGKTAAELENIIAGLNKQFKDIQSKDGYQADSKETKSAQDAIRKLVTLAEKRSKEELSEAKSRNKQQSFEDAVKDWQGITDEIAKIETPDALRSKAAGDDGEIVEEKLNKLIEEQQKSIEDLEKRVRAYVGSKNIKSTDIRTAQSNLEKAKSALNTLSTNATPQDISTDTNVPSQPELTEEEKKLLEKQRKQQELLENASDKFIELKSVVRNRAKEEGELKHIGNSAEKNYDLAKSIVDSIDVARKKASDAAKAADLDTAEIEQYGRTRYNDALGKLNAAATSITKQFIKEVYDGPLDKLEEALGNKDKLEKELGVSGKALELLSAAEKGSKIENAVKSAIKEEQDAKKKVADQEFKDAEAIRKQWDDALKADIVDAKAAVDIADTTEAKEEALKQLADAQEVRKDFISQMIGEGSELFGSEDLAKAGADEGKTRQALENLKTGISQVVSDYIKDLQNKIKAIMSNKDMTATDKAQALSDLLSNEAAGRPIARNIAEQEALESASADLAEQAQQASRASQEYERLEQNANDVANANRRISEAGNDLPRQITEHRRLADIYRLQAEGAKDAVEQSQLLAKAAKEDATAMSLEARQAADAHRIAKDAQQAFMQIVDMVNSATNKVIGLIRSSIGLANKGVNATVNGGKKIVSTLGRVVQLFGSLSNRVRSCIAAVINFARSTTQALGRVLNGVRSLIANFNIFNRQAAGKNGLSLVFTELNSAISLAERAFNGLFNNQLLAKSIKFDSTIASITMLLGGEATDDAQEFAKALQDGFNISYSQTISDLQEITTLLKAAGLEASGLTGTGIANAAHDLYAISQYFGALGMAGGSAAEVMSKLESGMKGMTQSIDDLGLSVRENDMNEFLKKNDQNVKFSELNEANKEAVRLGAIIDQFTNNFDILDFSKLLEQPYYQISLIKSQITEIGTIIGKIFEGIISKYLPTILGALQLIRDTLEGIAGGLGIDLSGDEVQKSLEGIADAAGDVSDGMDDAAKATKDYTNTAGFDEITSLNSGSDEQKLDIDKLLANVGRISDLLQEAAKGNVKDYETLMDKWSKFVKDRLGDDADPLFGFNKDKAIASLKRIRKDIKRWWNSFKDTTLTLGLKFADDLQAGRFANDVLRLVDAIAKLVAIIQEQLSPVVQDFYDKHLSKYVKEFGDKFNEFSKSFKKRVNQLDKDLKGGMTFGDAWKKNFGSILPPDLQTRLEKIIKIVKTLYEEYITPIKDAVLTTFDTIGTLSMGGLNIVESTITKGEEGESLLDKVLGNYQTFSKDKLQPWIESTTNSIASYIETHKTEIANLIDQIANDLFDVFTLLADIVGKLITWNIENPEMLNTIAETAKKVLGFVSDNFDTIMRIVELFVQLISASIDGLLSGIQIIFDKIAELDTVKPGEDKSQLQNIIDNVCKFIKAIWEDLGTGIANLMQWVADNEDTVDKALTAVEDMTGFFSDDVVELLGAIAAIKTVTGIATLASDLTKFAGGLEAIGSFFGLTKVGGSLIAGETAGGVATGTAVGIIATIAATVVNVYNEAKVIYDIITGASWDQTLDDILSFVTVLSSAVHGLAQQGALGFVIGTIGGTVKDWILDKLGIKDAVEDILTSIKDFVVKVGNWVLDFLGIKDEVEEVVKILSKIFGFDSEESPSLAEAEESMTNAFNKVSDHISDQISNHAKTALQADSGGYYQALQYAKRPVKIRALGGSVPSGQLFIANEAGNPELIGQIGKKTGADVANRGMITDAMETAVYNGLVDALNQSRQQATTGMSTPTTINVNGFGLIDKNALRQFAKILAPYLSANKDSFITA